MSLCFNGRISKNLDLDSLRKALYGLFSEEKNRERKAAAEERKSRAPAMPTTVTEEVGAKEDEDTSADKDEDKGKGKDKDKDQGKEKESVSEKKRLLKSKGRDATPQDSPALQGTE